MFSSMMHSADAELVFKGGKRLPVHSAVLSITSSEVLGNLLTDLTEGLGTAVGKMAQQPPGPLQLHLEDDPEEWKEVLPLLYPRMSVPRLTWVEVRRVLGIAHKYDIQLVLKACELFLNGDGQRVEPAQLSAQPADPNYVLTWLEISERLHLDALFESSGADSSSTPDGTAGGHHRPHHHHSVGHQQHEGCSCACASCGGFRASCRCGPVLPAPLPSSAAACNTSYGGSAAAGEAPVAAEYIAAGHGAYANGHGASTAAGGGGGRGYVQPPGSYAEIYASAQRQLQHRHDEAVDQAYRMLYRRDAAGPPGGGGGGAGGAGGGAGGAFELLRHHMHHIAPAAPQALAAAAAPQQLRHRSPDVSAPRAAGGGGLVRSAGAYGSSGSAAGRSPPGAAAATAADRSDRRALEHAERLSQPLQPPRVLDLVKGDREGLLKLSGQALAQMLGL
ncbi:hypothetical protein HYH02_002001 [Chlamydomonas schloesseri]|uniref:BTB domain-containing protein n=1 Tax=Chlamydomonas schloesseri TaxID=2026947 RepID=A0A835WTP4_9CHLO|nr:hypothetical protein HYH02_002001 [Chlamydomonas schloesseri]|eukprot:KAG2453792.1 hypothetical protein HYH02_002001 [Chlamydomonas schloesseri]